MFGDPSPGNFKTLRVVWDDHEGRHEQEVGEYSDEFILIAEGTIEDAPHFDPGPDIIVINDDPGPDGVIVF